MFSFKISKKYILKNDLSILSYFYIIKNSLYFFNKINLTITKYNKNYIINHNIYIKLENILFSYYHKIKVIYFKIKILENLILKTMTKFFNIYFIIFINSNYNLQITETSEHKYYKLLKLFNLIKLKGKKQQTL